MVTTAFLLAMVMQLAGPPMAPTFPESVGLYRRVAVDTLTRAYAVRAWYVGNHGVRIKISILRPDRRVTSASARDQIDSLTASLAALHASGALTGYRVAYVDSARIEAGRSHVKGYSTAIPLKSQTGSITVAMAFVYPLADRYVMVQAMVPPRELDRADIPEFARRFIVQYLGGDSP